MKQPDDEHLKLAGLVLWMNASQGYCRTPDIAEALGITDKEAGHRMTPLVLRGMVQRDQGVFPQTGKAVDYFTIPPRAAHPAEP